MNTEPVPVTHSECGGQGCRFCNQGENVIWINTEEQAA